ncbi:MAG: PAS domain-containing sensor histidine kinase [Candidatus Binatia bacterium]
MRGFPSERSPVDAAAAVDAALVRGSNALIARRFPYFAAGWIATGIVLRAGLLARGELSPPLAAATILLQALVLGIAVFCCRAEVDSDRIPRIAFVACVVLVFLSAGFFSLLGGSVEGFTFAVLLISIGSAYACAWGWRPTLVLLAVSGVVVGTVAPMATSLQRFSDPILILLEGVMGAAISLVIAEASARSFASSFRLAHAQGEAARRLAAAYDAYRDLAENAPDFIFSHDLEGRITYVSEIFARSFGFTAADLIGRAGADLLPRDVMNPDAGPLRARLAGGESVPPQIYCVKAPGGDRRWLECATSAIRDGDGKVIGARGIARDVTARRAAEEALRHSLEELQRSEERLRRLARHQASIREDERKRLGFDLHDDVCQELVGIGILVEAARRRVAAEAPGMEAELERIGRYVGEVSEHLRQLARELRPMLLRDLGLEESLHSLAEGLTVAGTVVGARFTTAIPRLGEDTEIGVYRIAQEAMANAVRHARAREIRLTLGVQGRELTLEIADDGCGFALANRHGSEALGLVGMEERALALGGHLIVRSGPGEGTNVRLVCPVALRAPASAA